MKGGGIMPLADKYRPTAFCEMVGNENLVGTKGVLTKMAATGRIPSLIFYGPPGCGKTTAALLLAESASKPLCKLNAVSAGTGDIKKIADAAKDTPCLLYLDEIQYFNKKQQQSLLPYLEDGSITLIAATTENPYHNVFDAILSRCNIIEFKRIEAKEICEWLKTVAAFEGWLTPTNNPIFCEESFMFISEVASGDARRALNLSELAVRHFTHRPISKVDLASLQPSQAMSGFDMDGDVHYHLLSGLQKAIRGSDPDAAVFYLSRLLHGGDILSPCRRLLVIACEDIGLACPDAIAITYACTQTAQILGLPEAFKPLVHATLFLALCKKSSTNEGTYFPILDDIKSGFGANVPHHLQNLPSSDYKYPHDYPHHWIDQQYLPDDLLGKTYYKPGDNDFEKSAAKYWWDVKHGKI
jgi:putative ATPase